MENTAILSSFPKYTTFTFGDTVLTFRTCDGLERCTSVKTWDNGYIEVMAKYAHMPDEKVDQHNERDTWARVPIQDLTSNSDIDRSNTVHEIDEQLYRKYGLSDDEINFIESHIKEME